MRHLSKLCGIVLLLAGLAAQQPVEVPMPGGKLQRYQLHQPIAAKPSQTRPLLLLQGKAQPIAGYLPLVQDGWRLVELPSEPLALAPLIRHLRLRYRIEGQRIFVLETPATAAWLTRAKGHLRPVPGAAGPEAEVLALRKARRGPLAADSLRHSLGALLDDYHDAAAKGDGERYFGHMAPDGVFLGTDGKERWSTAAFRQAFAKYFKGVSAWIYVPQSRQIRVRGEVAWFDEALHSDSYGACRGSGCLVRDGDSWKILLYHLSVPLPNELAKGIVAQIKRGGQAAAATTVILVRHAEKEKQGRDPGLSAAGQERARRLARHLASAGVQTVFSTRFRRTRATVAPLCAALGLEPQLHSPRFDLGARIRAQHRGQTILVSGHSNTVPQILRQLGVKAPPAIDESVYDNLFIVHLDPGGAARMLRLRY